MAQAAPIASVDSSSVPATGGGGKSASGGASELSGKVSFSYEPEDGADGYALRDLFSKSGCIGYTYDDVILLPGKWTNYCW